MIARNPDENENEYQPWWHSRGDVLKDKLTGLWDDDGGWLIIDR